MAHTKENVLHHGKKNLAFLLWCSTPYRVKKVSKHGQRAPDQTVLSVPMTKKLRAQIAALAKRDKRKAVQFIRLHLEEIVRQQKGAPTDLGEGQDQTQAHPQNPRMAGPGFEEGLRPAPPCVN